MTSTLDSLLLTRITDLFDMAGETVTYTPADGSAASTPEAIPAPAEIRQIERDGQLVQANVRQFTVRISDVAAPAIGDRIALDGETWAVDEIPLRTAVLADLDCVLLDRLEISDPRGSEEVGE